MSVSLNNLGPIDVRPIRRALISVYDKTGLEDPTRALGETGMEIVPTGSTAARIVAVGVAVTPVNDVTGFPEVLEGRMKTLYPFIHSDILVDQYEAAYREQITQLGIQAFDLAVCNLYPFRDMVMSGVSFNECIEQVDIGGLSMVRAAAKNHPSVAAVISPEHYANVAEAVAGKGFTLEQCRVLVAEAFTHAAIYDLAIAGWPADELGLEDVRKTPDDATEIRLDASDVAFLESLGYQAKEDYVVEAPEEEGQTSGIPVFVANAFERVESLRYGKNPYQGVAACYEIDESFEDEGADDEAWVPGIVNIRQLRGKTMSYNDYTGGDTVLCVVYDHKRPCVVIIKHTNLCGIVAADGVAETHRLAHVCDSMSTFGGVIAMNRPMSVELAHQIIPIFIEIALAPDYEEDTLEVLSAKKNLRVLWIEPLARGSYELKRISGGLLVQERDDIDAPGNFPENWTLATDAPADEAALANLEFVWRTVRAVRSNAALLVKDGASVGVGMGQVNRVDSCKLVVERASMLGSRSTGDAAMSNADSAGGAHAFEIVDDVPEQCFTGAVTASDAFFPFAGGLQMFIDAGARVVIQPSGSVRDRESIDAADAAGITMYLTGTRYSTYQPFPFIGSRGRAPVWRSSPEIYARVLDRGVVFSILFNCWIKGCQPC